MPPPEDSVWFRIGYAVERMRSGALRDAAPQLLRLARDRATRKVSWPGLDRAGSKNPGRASDESEGRPAGTRDEWAQALGLAGAGALGLKLLSAIPSRRPPGLMGLARAGAAGAIVGLLIRAVAAVRHPDELRDPVDRHLLQGVLAGAGRGLLYAQALEPRLSGPAALRGLAFGLLAVAAAPWGRLDELLAPLAPHRRVPLLREAFADSEHADDTVTDMLVFGIGLGLLYGRGPEARIGIVPE